MYTLSKEQVNTIKKLLNERKSFQIKTILKDLEVYQNPIINKLERFLRNKGKSTILHSEIREIIREVKMEEENQEMEKEELEEEQKTGEEESSEDESEEEEKEENQEEE